MSAKVFFIFCAHALFAQFVLSFCPGRAAGFGPYGVAGPRIGPAIGNTGLIAPNTAYTGLAAFPGRGYPCDGLAPAVEFTATSGGVLPVTSSSAIAPTGITVVSENIFEGPLSVAGELPFVGTTGMEGDMPSAGAGAINHACGDGVTAMVSEAAFAPASAATVIPGAGFGASTGLGLGLSSGFGPANRLGLGGCRGAFY